MGDGHLFFMDGEKDGNCIPTGFPVIAHISVVPGPIIKPLDSMKVKTGRIFLVYDKASYWLYYHILCMKMFFTRFSQKWFMCAHSE